MTAETPEDEEQRKKERSERIRKRKLKNKRKTLMKKVYWLLFAVGIVIADQISKWAVMEQFFRDKITRGQVNIGFIEWYLNTPEKIPTMGVPVTSFFNLVMAWNTGVSFSLFNDGGKYAPYILSALALGIAGMFAVWLWRSTKNFQGLCYAMVIGGAIGNVLDRLRFGAVIDFLDFHIADYHWPAFNVADVSIVVGISVLIILSFYFEIRTVRRYRNRIKARTKNYKYMKDTFKT